MNKAAGSIPALIFSVRDVHFRPIFVDPIRQNRNASTKIAPAGTYEAANKHTNEKKEMNRHYCILLSAVLYVNYAIVRM